MIAAGAVLAGKYRVLAMLGRGGMGTVFRAENLLTGKHVALKCLNSPLTAASDATQRLLREARAASSVSHPNVVDIYDIVQDRDHVFLVMELLHGETLRSYLQRNLQPKISEFIALILPAIAGATAAHACGVIHRDLKPDNIFLARVPERPHAVAKVLDFGISKQIAPDNATLTRTGATLGTPLYMSLEQLRGDKNIDARTDVYAMGVILYEAISGCLPHHADTLPELAIKLATVQPPSLKSLRPDIPTSLTKLIDWALSRDREQRPTMRTLFDELQVFARDYSFREQLTQADGVLPRIAAVPTAPASQPTAAAVAPTLALAAGTSALGALPSTLRGDELASVRTRIGHLRRLWIPAGLLCGLVAVGWRALDEPPTPAVSERASVVPVARQPGAEPMPVRVDDPSPLHASGFARNSDAPMQQIPAQAPDQVVHSSPAPPAPLAIADNQPPTAAELGLEEVVHSPPAPPLRVPAAQSTAKKKPPPAAKLRATPRQAAEAQTAPVPESAAPAHNTAVEWVGF